MHLDTKHILGDWWPWQRYALYLSAFYFNYFCTAGIGTGVLVHGVLWYNHEAISPTPLGFCYSDSTTCCTVLILSCCICCTVYETIAGLSPWMQFCVWWDILVLYCVWWCATCGVCKITPSCLHEPGRWARRRNLHAWMTQMRDFSVVSLGSGSRVKACG